MAGNLFIRYRKRRPNRRRYRILINICTLYGRFVQHNGIDPLLAGIDGTVEEPIYDVKLCAAIQYDPYPLLPLHAERVR